MQLVFNGVANGLAVAVLALAFQLVYLPTKIFYFAIAAVYALAPFPAWQLLQWGVPLPLAVLGGVAASALVSVLMELLTHGPMERKRASFSAQFIASLGYYIVIAQVLSALWGNDPKQLRGGVDPILEVHGVYFSQSRMILAGGCLVMVAAFFLWLRTTQVGLQFRALSDNARELAIRGYNIEALRITAFALSGILVGVLATLSALDTGFYSYSGLPVFLLAVVAAIIGGRYSFLGAVIGGILLGVMRAEVEWFLSSRWLNVATFGLLVLFLLFRPQGIMAKVRRLEAEA